MSNDPIQFWLNNAGRFPLLPADEIIRLAKKRDTLTPGSQAYVKVINKICEHNLRLVPNVVRKYLAKRINHSMSSEVAGDLLQQGYLGLRRAAEKFDGTRGFTFSTYAHNWIYQAFTRWHNSCDRVIYVPENAQCEVLHIKRNGCRSNSKNGRIRADVLEAAVHAQYIKSVDVRIGKDDDHCLSDLMGEDNRIISRDSFDEDWAAKRLRDLMAECGIRPKTQDVVSHYARRGRMSIVAAKVGMSQKHCQNIYGVAVRQMKEHVKAKEAAKAAANADRLAK